MVKKRFLSVALVFLGFVGGVYSSAITYKLAGGRLGDQLVNYVHAKWIAYKYGVPLFYRSFAHAEYFAFHKFEQQMPVHMTFDRVVNFQPGQTLKIDPQANVLYELSFFPDNPDERVKNKKRYLIFDVDWSDQKFCEIVRAYLQPTKPLNLVNLVPDAINVALHVRRGGGFDHTATSLGHGKYRADLVLPARFPPDDFFCEQVALLAKYFTNKRLSFFIFTDYPSPNELVEKYSACCPGIKFNCRSAEERAGVVDDLFSMARFDVIVRPQSNFSLMAAHIGGPLLEIWPEGCTFDGKKWVSLRTAYSMRLFGKTIYDWTDMPNRLLLLNSYKRSGHYES